MGSPPGAMRSKPINTARGTPWDLADLRLYGLRHASMSRGVEARGSEHFKFAHSAQACVRPGPLASRAPSVLYESGGKGIRLTRGRPKNTGDDARPPFPFVPAQAGTQGHDV
jgi:hypothetical protein